MGPVVATATLPVVGEEPAGAAMTASSVLGGVGVGAPELCFTPFARSRRGSAGARLPASMGGGLFTLDATAFGSSVSTIKKPITSPISRQLRASSCRSERRPSGQSTCSSACRPCCSSPCTTTCSMGVMAACGTSSMSELRACTRSVMDVTETQAGGALTRSSARTAAAGGSAATWLDVAHMPQHTKASAARGNASPNLETVTCAVIRLRCVMHQLFVTPRARTPSPIKTLCLRSFAHKPLENRRSTHVARRAAPPQACQHMRGGVL